MKIAGRYARQFSRQCTQCRLTKCYVVAFGAGKKYEDIILNSTFDKMAEEFDTQYRIDRAQILADTINKELNLTEMTNVMEFGCGTGLIILNLLDSLQAIALVDSSKGMLTVLKDKINKINSNKQISIYNDINSYELQLESFDCIYSSMVLHHISNIPKYRASFKTQKQNDYLG